VSSEVSDTVMSAWELLTTALKYSRPSLARSEAICGRFGVNLMILSSWSVTMSV